MAPNLTVHFWAASDILGDPILEITDEDPFFREFTLKPDLYGLGAWELVLARKVGFALFDSGAVQPEVFVRFLVHAWSDTEYYDGGVLQKRLQTVIHRQEQGEEVFVFGGPGPKQYMDRYRLGITQETGTGWNLDLVNGVWRWKETATAGRVLNRVVAEDAAQDDPAVPDLSKSFTDALDSNGDAWTADIATSDDYEIPIGTSLLEVVFELEDLSDLVTTIHLGEAGAPEYRLDAWNAYGVDVTGSSPGAGVGLLREGLNIANDALVVEGVALRKASHVIVEGKDGEWTTAVRPSWSPGDPVKWAKITYARSSNPTILERAGLRWLRSQENGDKQITVEMVPGSVLNAGYTPATAEAFPGPGATFWLGNTVTLDTTEDGATHTPLDYNNEDQLLTGLELELGPAGDTSTADAKRKSWDVKLKLNGERGGHQQAPSQGTTGAPGKCNCPAPVVLCETHVPGDPASEIITPVKAFNANSDGGDTLTWAGILSNQSGGAGGSSHYYFKSTAPDEWSNVYAVSAGVILRVSGYFSADDAGETLKLGFFNTGVGSAGNGANLIGSHTVLAVGPKSKWHAFLVEVTAPVGTVGFALGRSGGGVSFDQVSISSVVYDPGDAGVEGVCPEDVGLECATGTLACAARGDHVHAHGLLSDGGTHHHNATDIEGGVGALSQAYAGKNAIGASKETMTLRRIFAQKITLANACLITDIEAYVESTAIGQVMALQFLLLSDNAGAPHEILNVNGSMGDNTLHIAATAVRPRWLGMAIGRWVPAGDYWIAVQSLDAGPNSVLYKDTSGGTCAHWTPNGGWFQDGVGSTVTTTTHDYSLRANTVR